ncbi:MAG: methylmalonyl Co-A mutase-associated GTPase MeaB [Chloroflexi bacterium]|nr:methylmalonyl Co-A mutase-associated GTPase MeaB [Chloroflexota bacterium]
MKLADKVLEGDIRAAAKLMRAIEDESTSAIDELCAIYPHTGKAYIVGLTGAPGVGKSTLINNLINVFRTKGIKIGVVAVDPTSPFTGGAILGDRVRMQQHGLDEDVFIRSMATRGWMGGLAKATLGMLHVMDAMGKDIIMVETVGVGQSEVEIAKVADTSILVLSPASGDEMQMIKAGIMEIADIFVVNKADRGGAENIAGAIEFMLSMKTYLPGDWRPCTILCEAVYGKGSEQLVTEILKHKDYMTSCGLLERRRKERARLEVNEAIEGSIASFMHQSLENGGEIEKLVDEVAQRSCDPTSAALKIIEQFSKRFHTTQE